jgi:hypothetical protein
LLYFHFLDGCQNTDVGHPSTVSGYLLENELVTLATRRGDYEVLLNTVSHLSDGRPMQRFVARRHSTRMSNVAAATPQ